MAQNISLMGASYADVPAVELPKTGGGTARFDDTSDANATASDIAHGKTAYVGGEKVTGTASGGGSATLIAKTITTNGTYDAQDDGADGYSEVTVNVSGGDEPDPTDGKTHIWIEIPEDAPSNRLTYYVRYTQSVSKGVTVDWGDGSTPEAFTGTSAANQAHTYAQGGKYEITLTVTSGTIKFTGSGSYSIFGASNGAGYGRRSSIKRVFFGSGLATNAIGGYALPYCYGLQDVTIPAGVTSIGSCAFSNCYGMAKYHLKPTAPPALSGTDAFSSIQSDCKIYVPYSEDHSILEAYKAATNWSTYASKMVEEDPE